MLNRPLPSGSKNPSTLFRQSQGLKMHINSEAKTLLQGQIMLPCWPSPSPFAGADQQRGSRARTSMEAESRDEDEAINYSKKSIDGLETHTRVHGKCTGSHSSGGHTCPKPGGLDKKIVLDMGPHYMCKMSCCFR